MDVGIEFVIIMLNIMCCGAYYFIILHAFTTNWCQSYRFKYLEMESTMASKKIEVELFN